MKKSSALYLVLLLLTTLLVAACGGAKPAGEGGQAAPSAQENALDRVKKAGKLLVAVDTSYPPMEFIGEDNKTEVGFDVDLAKAIAKKLGVEAEFVVMDWDGILPGLLGKRYDVIISSMNITEERLKQVDFVEYVQMSQLFVSTPGVTVKTEQDLAGLVVAVQAETTSHEWVDKVKAERVKDIKEIRSFKGATDAFLEAKNGRAQVIVIDEPVGLYYAAKDKGTFTITGRAMDPEPVGIAVRKEDGDLKKALEQAVKEIKEDGTFSKISQTWFGDHELGK